MTNKTDHLRKLIYRYASRGGEEIKRGMPVLIREAHRDRLWQDVVKPDGSRVSSLADWLITPPPIGCGLGCTKDSWTYDALADLYESLDETQDVAKILRSERPKGKAGRRSSGNDVRTHGIPSSENSRSRPVLASRLQQEKPRFYQAFLDGKYRSIRAACEAAGLVRPANDPLARMKSNWKKATKSQRRKFMQWVSGTTMVVS